MIEPNHEIETTVDLDLKDPWLVAVWPGMGGIAQIAGTTLGQVPSAERVAELPPNGHFETEAVDVREGIVRRPSLPESALFSWRNPGEGPDLLVFVGGRQPPVGGYRFCQGLMDLAQRFGVTRVVTFAAMAAPIRPDAEPRVLAAATDPETLQEARAAGAEVLAEGNISGMNGVLLAAAAERGVSGFCLLGEFPFFAHAIANPKASAAVLRVFARIAGLELNLTGLDTQAVAIEKALTDHLAVLEEEAARASQSANGDHETTDEEKAVEPGLDRRAKARIEELFERARKDRSQAHELKAELDRHGVFGEYEDRFLDLFKDAD